MPYTYFRTFNDYLIYRKISCINKKTAIGPMGNKIDIPNDRNENLNCIFKKFNTDTLYRKF